MDASLSAALVRDIPKTELDLQALRHSEGEALLQQIVAYRGRMLAVLAQAEDDGDYRAISSLHGRLLEAWRHEAEFLGELNLAARNITNNVLIAPAYIELRAGILSALQAYPEAARAVAAVLHRTETKIIENVPERIAAA